jgi:hypothetical protein
VEKEHRPWLWALTSTLVIGLGLYFLVTLPDTYGEARRYETADRCAGDGEEPPTCVEVVPGVVERVFSRRGGKGGPDHHLDLRVGETATFPPHRQPKEVEVEDTFGDPEDEDADDGVYDSFRAGDRVELGYWGRQLSRVTKPGVGSVETIASPQFDAGVGLTLGPLLPLLGGFGWWGAVALRRRSGSWREKTSFGRQRPSAVRALGIGAVFGISTTSVFGGNGVGTDVWMVVVLWVLGALGGMALAGVLLLVGFVVRRLRRLRDD